MRAAIARRMSDSKRTAPHFYVSAELDMDAVQRAVNELNEGRAVEDRVTITAFLVRAVAASLSRFPALNAVWNADTLEVVEQVNMGVAVALDEGLIAPALIDVGAMDVDQLSVALRDLATRARSGKLRAAEMTEATFTLTNLGMFPVSSFTAIITPPQVAILATGRVAPRPVVVDGRVEVRSQMTATLSADHRAVDGVLVARFLSDLGDALRKPESFAGIG
ncbi:MAG: 2-oxo acid dehydrogenase subunit E2 [Chloroflexi bacterium]|nr:2-oxo acid dehydrogenase subunit E2 [Chloroflexota bacterium]